MDINELIENVRLNIEDNKIKSNNVGNRPHYPVFVAFNGSSTKDCSAFVYSIQNTWSSQICKQLLFYRYDYSSSVLNYKDIHLDNEITAESIYERISEASKKSDIFAKYDMWCFYNVIDTSRLTFEKFQEAYLSLKTFKGEIDRRIRSMIIVVLKEDRAKERKAINYQIRDFLRGDTIYDSIVIVSNRARGNYEIESEEIYKIISNLVLLSNNDAVTTADDDYYNERIRKLYSRTPLIMSYNSLSKPTYDILSCMIQMLVAEVASCIEGSNSRSFSSNDIEEVLGIENGKLIAFENFIQRIKQRTQQELDYDSIFQYLPLNTPSVINSKDIETKTIGQLAEINKESLNLLAEEYCKKYIESDEGEELFKEYTEYINNKLNLLNVRNVSEDKILEVFETLFERVEKLNSSDTPRIYFSALVVSILKTRYIFPYCIKLAKNICNAEIIEATKIYLDEFRRNIDEELPVTGFDDIATFYGKNMSQYLQTDLGKSNISQILKVGNSYDDICKVVEETLYNANEYCNEKIDLPFITIWANALKLHEGEIFGRIRNTLYGDGDDAILLRGSYPVNEELSVYMLHCYDRNAENETELFKQFKKAYKDVAGVQFFNTGNDDSIESIKFYRCAGTSLILMEDMDS